MRFAYADPPYLGCGQKLYGHPEWDDLDTHLELLESLDEYDAWALSLHEPSLSLLAPHKPEDARIAAWVKPFAVFSRESIRLIPGSLSFSNRPASGQGAYQPVGIMWPAILLLRRDLSVPSRTGSGCGFLSCWELGPATNLLTCFQVPDTGKKCGNNTKRAP